MSILALDTADAVNFLVSYDKIGESLLLHIRAFICQNTVLYNPISLLYCSIIFLADLL